MKARLFISPVILVAGFILIFSSCASEQSKKAEQRLEQAAKFYEEKQYEKSLRVLDSIQSWYPNEYNVLSKALELQKTVAREYHEGFIEQASSLLEKAEPQIEDLSKNFYFTGGNGGRPGTYEHKRQTIRNSWNRSFLKVNVTEDGDFWLTSKYYGDHWIDHFCVKVYDRDIYEFSDTIPLSHPDNKKLQDGNDKWETVDYKDGADSGITPFIIENLERRLKVRFTGREHYYIIMETFDKEAVRDGYQLAQVLREVNDLRSKIDRHRKELRVLGISGEQ
jgi:hypothetical protein